MITSNCFTIISLNVLVFGDVLAASMFAFHCCDRLSGYMCFNVAAALVALNHKLTTY